jgi:hypothetical protein
VSPLRAAPGGHPRLPGAPPAALLRLLRRVGPRPRGSPPLGGRPLLSGVAARGAGLAGHAAQPAGAPHVAGRPPAPLCAHLLPPGGGQGERLLPPRTQAAGWTETGCCCRGARGCGPSDDLLCVLPDILASCGICVLELAIVFEPLCTVCFRSGLCSLIFFQNRLFAPPTVSLWSTSAAQILRERVVELLRIPHMKLVRGALSTPTFLVFSSIVWCWFECAVGNMKTN